MRLLPRNRTLYGIIGFYNTSTNDVMKYKIQYKKLSIGDGLIMFKLFGPKLVDNWYADYINDNNTGRPAIFNSIEEAKAIILEHEESRKEERLRKKRTNIIYLDFVDED